MRTPYFSQYQDSLFLLCIKTFVEGYARSQGLFSSLSRLDWLAYVCDSLMDLLLLLMGTRGCMPGKFKRDIVSAGGLNWLILIASVRYYKCWSLIQYCKMSCIVWEDVFEKTCPYLHENVKLLSEAQHTTHCIHQLKLLLPVSLTVRWKRFLQDELDCMCVA